MMAILTVFRARALAPLSMMALTVWACLRTLGFETSIFTRVFPLAFIRTVAGAVRFKVYG